MLTLKKRLLYKDLTLRIAQESYCIRAKVGCVIVDSSGQNILAFGYNGTVSGEANVCECDSKTKSSVLHAETNALTKLCRSTQSSDGAIMFCTLSPCMDCAKMILQCGIQQVFYIEKYDNPQSDDVINFLSKHISIMKL